MADTTTNPVPGAVTDEKKPCGCSGNAQGKKPCGCAGHAHTNWWKITAIVLVTAAATYYAYSKGYLSKPLSWIGIGAKSE